MPGSGFNESISEILPKTLPKFINIVIWMPWNCRSSILFIPAFRIYVKIFFGIVSGFNGVVAINKTELNRLRQVSSCDLQQRSGSVTFFIRIQIRRSVPTGLWIRIFLFLQRLAKNKFFSSFLFLIFTVGVHIHQSLKTTSYEEVTEMEGPDPGDLKLPAPKGPDPEHWCHAIFSKML
jgi:hypothetical protein